MSLDAGGLAQMTYNHAAFGSGLGMPASGFASRGKGSHIKPLSMNSPNRPDSLQPAPPRTSRSHLLAGLRTAPKSPTFPTSAPLVQVQQGNRLDGGRQFDLEGSFTPRGIPQTTTGASFPSTYKNRFNSPAAGQMYSLPEQVLAPPAIQIGDEQGDLRMDQGLYEELVRTNQYLAQQQMRLQQQLINVTAAAQQFQDLNIGVQQPPPYEQLPMASHMGLYQQQQQQLQNGLQSVVQAVPNQPGLYAVYNPMNGQVSYYVDQNATQNVYEAQQSISHLDLSHSPPPPTPTFRAQVSPPPESPSPMISYQNPSPPRASPSPPQEEVNPLPPPSANAFRPGHRKALSLANGFNSISSAASDGGLKSAGPKSSGIPPTPLTGTFGPGQARAGEHPIRQPRGPPSLEELVAKPTTKFEGSKNFATRQRRRAVHNLMRAGIERRTASRGTGSPDSAESTTPVSETEIVFSVSSDNESDGAGSGTPGLAVKLSLGSLRAAANGAIGSERKELKERSRERGSADVQNGSMSGEEQANSQKSAGDKLEAPLLVLPTPEKRRSSCF